MGSTENLEAPHKTTEDCRFCWMCRHVCPVGHVTHRETLTPHAWALTISSVERGLLQWDADSADVLYACADCGMCRTHCVTDRPLPDAIVAARADVAKSGAAPAVVYALHEKLRRWGNPYAEGSGAAGARAAGAAAHANGSATPASGGAVASTGEVALFVGDVGAHISPRTVEAAIALLAAAGVKAVPIGGGRSNGLLASALGFPETAAEHARAVLADVAAAGCRELLVLGPGDRFAFEHVYRDRLGIAWPEAVAVREVTTVLAEALSAGKLSFRHPGDPNASATGTPGATAAGAASVSAPTYAYHDPCHGPRIARDAAAPRALLAAALGEAPARRLFWREERAHPCGAIGGLEFTQPDIAARLADARLADAASAGASWLITDDPGCLHHLRGRDQSAVEVCGLYELLEDSLAR